MTYPSDIEFFPRSDLQHPDMMNEEFMRWVSKVRKRAGVPFVVTNDGRQDGDPEPSGSAGNKSLHHRGCALDLRSRNWNAVQKFKVMEAIAFYSHETPHGWKVEFEVVYDAKGDQHWHLGLDWNPGKDHEMIEADD